MNIKPLHLTLLLVALSFNVTIVCAQKPLTRPPKTTTNSSSSSKPTTTHKPTSSTSATKPTNGTSVSPATGTINGYEYVDLGLSVKWARCNMGASSPSDYGDYYAWGETRTKSEYTEDNSVTYEKNYGSIAGNPNYDAATANWGGTWRMPTEDEIDEIVEKCNSRLTTMGGHKGYKIIGPNGNSIFLPAAGSIDGTDSGSKNFYGDYWTASPGVLFWYAYELQFWEGNFWRNDTHRSYGLSVRPVSE